MICRAQSSFYVASAEHIKNIIFFIINFSMSQIVLISVLYRGKNKIAF